MNKTAKIIVGVVVIALILVLLNDSKDDRSQRVNVGAPVPLSGVRADSGEYIRNGLVMAKDRIEADSSRRTKVDLVLQDTRFEPQTAVSAVLKMRDLDDVRYIVGPYSSSEALAIAPIIEESKIILIIPGAQVDSLSEAGDYIFRTAHKTSDEIPFFGPFLVSHMKGDVVDFLALNTAFSEPYIKGYKEFLGERGKKIGLVERYDISTTDFKAYLAKIKSSDPTDIFLIAVPVQAGLILKQAREMGITAQFYNIGVEGPDLMRIAGSAADGLLYADSFFASSSEPATRSFVSEYMTKFGRQPDSAAANAYDDLMLLSDCFEEVGIEVDKVKKCLYSTRGYVGASGTFDIDANGEAERSLFIKTIRGGVVTLFDK